MTFEVDANGILQVKAEDKVAKTSHSITITNDKGRLTEEEIEVMIREAEEFAEEDRVVKEKIDARNKLETYVYNMKSTVADKEKISDEDKEKMEEVLKEALEWLEENVNAEKNEYDEKMKEVESVCNPVIKSVYEKTEGESEEDDGDDRDEL